MPELIALIVFIAALAVIEFVYIKRGQKTISQHVQELVHSWTPAGALIGFVTGWALCHFTQ